jgi:hypothetical protein
MESKKNNYLNLLLRRVTITDLEIDFEDSLDSATRMYKNRKQSDTSLAQFRNIVLSMTMDGIHHELYSTLPGELQWYDGIFYALRYFFDDRIENTYNQLTNNQEDIFESEITERCWKGYTQKGMKTMFGKRYPNCVKIKKK